MPKKYIEVEWPEYQYAMDHPRWKECLFVDTSSFNPLNTSYMIPEDLYNEIYNNINNYEKV